MRRLSIWLAVLVTVAGPAVPSGIAQDNHQVAGSGDQRPESAGPEFRSASNAEQIELLRRLLGVKAPAAAVSPDAEAPAAAESKTTPAARIAPTPARKLQPAAIRRKPAPARPAATTPLEAVAPREAAQPAQTSAAPTTQSANAGGESELSQRDLPSVGTIINAANAERWTNLLTPSLRWSLQHGARMEISRTIPIEVEAPRQQATERYSSQVALSADRKALVNHVAGLPFPHVTQDDPDAAIKLIFNFENRIVIDDLDGRDFGCVTGTIDAHEGLQVERNYRVDHFRRLYYTGRLVVDPKPVWPNGDNLHYRESLGPISEPFDFKGAGFSYSRYLDPRRQDDSWLYYPQTKRVRRLSTAQRSEGVFGQDVDLDSYAGFAGNPAWFSWQILGKKTLLGAYHPKHDRIQWSAKPADFMFDEVWEPRETYILAARSLLPGYNFSLRTVYVDAQSFLIPYTEAYDNDGQLWRAYIQDWNTGKTRAMPYNTEAVYPVATGFSAGLTVFDMQQRHATRCEFPIAEASKEEAWYYWWGDKSGGTVPEDFDVATFIQRGR